MSKLSNKFIQVGNNGSTISYRSRHWVLALQYDSLKRANNFSFMGAPHLHTRNIMFTVIVCADRPYYKQILKEGWKSPADEGRMQNKETLRAFFTMFMATFVPECFRQKKNVSVLLSCFLTLANENKLKNMFLDNLNWYPISVSAWYNCNGTDKLRENMGCRILRTCWK